MVGGVVRSDSGAPTYGSQPAPWGFAARYSPRDLADYWLEVITLGPGRIGVLLGVRASSQTAAQLRSDTLAALLKTADPAQSLRILAGSDATALCAVIDQDEIRYSSHGHPGGIIAAPHSTPALLDCSDGPSVSLSLQPGSTLLLCTGPVDRAIALFDNSSATLPDELADRAILNLRNCAAVLYRHPPPPLSITLPADPGSLAVSRGKLREWLNAAGLDAETCADVLLAVGEATANATEHAVVGATDDVQISLDACFEPDALVLSVSDNGRWKPAAVSPGHRGHGIHLMNALMNSVELTTTPEGTTVTMVKEVPR
jgi:anti-sigma regulatory factor (Ser/Thr protein kinase)